MPDTFFLLINSTSSRTALKIIRIRNHPQSRKNGNIYIKYIYKNREKERYIYNQMQDKKKTESAVELILRKLT